LGGKMTEPPLAPSARLFTAFGTVIYFDVDSLEFRHGDVENSSANVLFVAESFPGSAYHRGWLRHVFGETWEPILCQSDSCRSVSQTDPQRSVTPTVLDFVPLERGLISLAADGLFLSAIPDGSIRLSAPVCSTWELFLASERWCTEVSSHETIRSSDQQCQSFDTKKIQSYGVHPINRVRANVRPRQAKLLIYGYPHWSHGVL
jgi:hypothetical protein